MPVPDREEIGRRLDGWAEPGKYCPRIADVSLRF